MSRHALPAKSLDVDHALTVLVMWSPGVHRDLARHLIGGEGLRRLGLPGHGVRVINHCMSCGSTEHGRPVLAPLPGLATPHVSISYADDVTVVALTGAGPVGVDVESCEAASFPGFDAVAVHEEEQMTGVRSRSITWVRKESLLKATGRGLAVDARQVRVTPPHESPGLINWTAADPPDGPVWMQDVEITEAHVAAVTVLAKERPELVVRRAELAAPRE